MRSKVGKLCIGCGRIYYSSKPRCSDCERKRSEQRPWYKTEVYRRAQQQARAMTGRRCPRCNTTMVGEHRPSVDHVTPVSRGGSWYGPFEIVCLKCNLIKGNRT